MFSFSPTHFTYTTQLAKLDSSCSSVSVDSTTSAPQSGGSVGVRFIQLGGLTPVTEVADEITFHIWTLSSFSVSVSDDSLNVVDSWPESCSNLTQFQYQTARIHATAMVTSGFDSFTANILPLVTNNVSCAS